MLTDRQIAQLLVERLCTAFEVRRAVWFGSRATGAGDPDSDWDLLVVAPSQESPAERGYRAEVATADVHVAKDFVVVTPAEYERLRSWRSSVVYMAEANGVVLHAGP
jgi:predicted nucleotidyltransferase